MLISYQRFTDLIWQHVPWYSGAKKCVDPKHAFDTIQFFYLFAHRPSFFSRKIRISDNDVRCSDIKVLAEFVIGDHELLVFICHALGIAREHLGEVVDHILLIVKNDGRYQSDNENQNVCPIPTCKNVSETGHIRYKGPVSCLPEKS